ncbi:SulP family inorganic anion transporter [Nitrosomonas sp. PY1]|uniref:SulP family inorganic anion transporter n=1 Tax=Nitrosomonas sp. PY1 TaxID=1803906 RepID=UPI001FC858F9|nr:SulP family inorganic anion transporter [Nitrosomonas sp. PY1]GKS70259.1 SulP family inorganic anion transporter [Nitrosomonas sp. PY1]
MKKIFPKLPFLKIGQGLLPIKIPQIPTEVIAGLTLAALAIPVNIGYSKIAGTPVITGLYTMLLPVLLFALVGGSRLLVVGADSATAAILAAGLIGIASIGTDEYLALAGILALMAAALLILARIIGLAFLADFLSRSVLIGFLTGVGIQVALGQISSMLGLKGGGHGTLQQIWIDVQQISQINYSALSVALVVLLFILVTKRISEHIPGALIAVIGAIAASWVFDFGASMHLVGSIPSGLPHFSLPQVNWDWSLVHKLLPIAFSMFLVILAQSAATSRVYAARHNQPLDQNADLNGLALANIGAGLSGTFVVAGSPTKTQIVDSAGGRTQLTHLVAAGVVILVLLFLTEPLAYMPECVLAVIVFLTGMDLIKFRKMLDILEEEPSEFWIALITTLMVIFVGIEQGVMLAMVLSLIEHTRHGYRPKNIVLEYTEDSRWIAHPVASKMQAVPGLMIYRFTHNIYYANASQLSREIEALIQDQNPPLRWFCIDASAISDVDYTATETLRSLASLLKKKEIHLVVSQMRNDFNEDKQHKILELFGKNAFFNSLDDVVAAYTLTSMRDRYSQLIPADAPLTTKPE